MNPLRDLWRRNPVTEYFAGLDRSDQVTFLVITALTLALTAAGLALSLMYAREPATSSAPAYVPARPFVMDFAAALMVARS